MHHLPDRHRRRAGELPSAQRGGSQLGGKAQVRGTNPARLPDPANGRFDFSPACSRRDGPRAGQSAKQKEQRSGRRKQEGRGAVRRHQGFHCLIADALAVRHHVRVKPSLRRNGRNHRTQRWLHRQLHRGRADGAVWRRRRRASAVSKCQGGRRDARSERTDVAAHGGNLRSCVLDQGSACTSARR